VCHPLAARVQYRAIAEPKNHQKREQKAREKVEHATGTRDVHYNLVSVLYHTLQGAETSVQYVADAEEADDQELAQFFRELQEEDRRRANRAKALLQQRRCQGGIRLG
jgi:hypothetical protein